MISLRLYKNLFIIAVAIQVLLFWSGYSHTIVTTMFFLATFGLVFSRDAKPDEPEDLLVPEVHYYQKEHLNSYSLAMVAMLAFVAFLFYFITTATSIRTGLISLPLWGLMIYATGKFEEMFSEGLGKEALIDFINIQFGGNLDVEIINSAVSALWQSNIYTDGEKVEKCINTIPEIPDDMKPLFISSYLEYMPLILDNPNTLVSDEIKAINQERKSVKKKRKFPTLRKKKNKK